MEDSLSKTKKENQLISLICNIVIPVIVMTKMNGTEGSFALGPQLSLVIAISFPLIYGIIHFVRSKQINFISVLGFCSVLLTGIFGLLELDPLLMAIKEASVPLIIAIVIFISIKLDKNIVSVLLFNEDIVDLKNIYAILDEQNKRQEFDIKFRFYSYWVVASFILSSILNFTLARIILQSQPGTEEYTAEIGKLTGLSFPIIAVPCTIILVVVMIRIFNTITQLTGLPFEQIVKTEKKD